MDFAVTLDDTREVPLHRQLHEELRRSILSGRLAPGSRVPSTRALARSLGVSRTTVTQCYEDLISEGYLQAAIGSGTFICEHLPEQLLKVVPLGSPSKDSNFSKPLATLSGYGNRVAKSILPDESNEQLPISFRNWRPAFDRIPLRQWRRFIARHCRLSSWTLFDYSQDPFGYQPLREAIAHYVSRARAVRCEPDRVVICSGAQRAIDLITRLLIEPGDRVAFEEPGYLGARQVFIAQGAKLVPVPVDEAGILVGRLTARSTSRIKMVYVSPSHQFPTGVLLSLSRRLELLAWAAREKAFIIEDDYDSEYRYCGRPVPALQGLDQNDSVIYVGTFSKVLFPSLRLGYLVVPRSLLDVLARAKWVVDRQSPLIEQCALADFINEGHLDRHIRRMRTLYDGRRKALVDAFKKYLPHRVSILGDAAGMHLTARLRTRFLEYELIDRAAKHGVEIVSTSSNYLQPCHKDEFIFGYSNLSEREIQQGIRNLAQALR